jgi:hypothetical protein
LAVSILPLKTYEFLKINKELPRHKGVILLGGINLTAEGSFWGRKGIFLD